MPYRFLPFATDHYYHIFNRGAARQPIFTSKRDYERFHFTLSYYRFNSPPVKLSRFNMLSTQERNRILSELEKKGNKLVEVLCYVYMPNHFHLILKQHMENGISTFLRRALNSYTRYFNTKGKRSGPLFQGVFKAVHVESDEQLVHLSRYIHLNPLVSYVVREENFISYPWSSMQDYLAGNSKLVQPDIVLSYFSSPTEYQKFVLDQVDYAKKLEEIKHLVLEDE